MPIPPRVSVVALRSADLVRSTAFYVALGWELSPASTAAMSLFKTAGSLLLVCTDELLAELGGQEVAAALAGEPTGEAVLSIHVATDGEVDAAVEEVAKAGGVVVKGAAPTPLGGSYAFFADPDGHVWEVIHDPPSAVSAWDRRAARGSLGPDWGPPSGSGGRLRPPYRGPGHGPRRAGRPPAPQDPPARSVAGR
jgi:uncharacterized protein